MKFFNRCGILAWGLLSLASCPLALAGPNCEKNPSHPACSGAPGSGTSSGTVFATTFAGDITGSGYSNPTENTGYIANLVFNKLASEVVFTINVESNCSGTYGGNIERLEATMQLYDGLGVNADMVARLYFQSGGDKYKIELFEVPGSPYGWDGGDFPPFVGGPITRSAGSWQIGKNGGPAGPCVGDSGTFSPPVVFTLSAQ